MTIQEKEDQLFKEYCNGISRHSTLVFGEHQVVRSFRVREDHKDNSIMVSLYGLNKPWRSDLGEQLDPDSIEECLGGWIFKSKRSVETVINWLNIAVCAFELSDQRTEDQWTWD